MQIKLMIPGKCGSGEKMFHYEATPHKTRKTIRGKGLPVINIATSSLLIFL
jgi:hypothetical protein